MQVIKKAMAGIDIAFLYDAEQFFYFNRAFKNARVCV